jgi:hypothetical protein
MYNMIYSMISHFHYQHVTVSFAFESSMLGGQGRGGKRIHLCSELQAIVRAFVMQRLLRT